MNRLSTQVCDYLMHHYARINAGHFFVGPCKDVTKFVKKIGIKSNGLGLRNVCHISFRGNLINLDRCLKGLKWETRSKSLETSKHILMGGEKRGIKPGEREGIIRKERYRDMEDLL